MNETPLIPRLPGLRRPLSQEEAAALYDPEHYRWPNVSRTYGGTQEVVDPEVLRTLVDMRKFVDESSGLGVFAMSTHACRLLLRYLGLEQRP